MQFSTQESDIEAAANEALKLLKDSETKAGNGFVLVDMESSYLTVELFRKLHLEPKKEKPNPRNAPSQNADIYSDNHFMYFPAEEILVQYRGNERNDDTKFSYEADSPTKLFLKLSLSLGHLYPSF
ncbi:hypothetical protein F2Q68_00017429 [Brassica cretica]|uniref:Uncharacterized protein n=1 Tax=Brassica cretica TaxID=69181 RepID=A0A8S9HWV6_BRACR|nr:hypothetical protein F2Q68_00017429 [Brassica cretica]